MKTLISLLAALTATPAFADVAEVVEGYILPGYEAFAETAADLSVSAESCDLEPMRHAWNTAFDAWLTISPIRFGPVESNGRAVSIAFWPDERGAGPRALATLRVDEDPIIFEEGGTARLSAAARGFFALEYLLYDPDFAPKTDYDCALIAALSDDLANLAHAILAEWESSFAMTLQTGGAPENQTYLTENEARQALFTALQAGLEFDAETRLGRPMGTFERPRPNRAESRRAGRSLHNLAQSLAGLGQLSSFLANGETPRSDAAFAHAQELISGLDDPVFEGVATPQGRFKLEALQQAIHAIRDAALAEIGPMLGVAVGFNSADGD